MFQNFSRNLLKELHTKLYSHLDEQSEKWNSLIYAKEKGFYQGFESIEIDGWRPSEKRLKNFDIFQYLDSTKTSLDIGSNCGFFSICVSKFVKHIDGVEINPYLVSISNDTSKFLETQNTTFYNTSFENFDSKKKYELIFSLGNDETIDGNTKFQFSEYVAKIYDLLTSGGMLFFETQAIDSFEPFRFEPKRKILENFFSLLEEKKVFSEYPVNVPERTFLVLKKL
jgi:hypothetical protein